MNDDKHPVICWLRRDLRLRDNLALGEAIMSGHPVILLFIFDPAILQSERISPARVKFMLDALAALRIELHKHQRDILIRHGRPLDVLNELIETTKAARLYYNHDYTPFARTRDDAICQQLSIPVERFHDRLLAEPGAILKDDGNPYTVYSPFKKQWYKRIKPERATDYDVSADTLLRFEDIEAGTLPTLSKLGLDETIDVPEASEDESFRLLRVFLESDVHDYADKRDQLGNNPGDDPKTRTSFLSPYIRFGLLSLREIYWSAREAYDMAEDTEQRKSVTKFVDEIIWHEFYTHILWHFPQVKTENFQTKYDTVAWRQDAAALQAWKDGRTGYPVVDAAMRQLKTTGWMHNRARMITASFLTKHLLIDWREGEKYFMQHLLDGDLAANNGGWQWTAGTGTDAQPYFRIFNPILQSKKFDPEGAFIRCWIPELRDVPDEFIHEPWNMSTPPEDYPAPIVDHAAARDRALEVFEAAAK